MSCRVSTLLYLPVLLSPIEIAAAVSASGTSMMLKPSQSPNIK